MSYLHAERAELEGSRTLAALFIEHEEDALGASVGVGLGSGAASPAGTARLVANVSISVPRSRLTPTPGSNGRQARLRLVMAVRPTDGTVLGPASQLREKFIEVPLPADPPAEGAGETQHEFVVAVPLPPGEQEIAVGVVDTGSGLATHKRLRVRL